MQRTQAALTLAASLLAGLGATAASGDARDKIYSAAQAKAGLALYDRQCATCHDGGTMGPELWGGPFVDQWRKREVGALFKRIQETMPENNPGSLSSEQTLQLVAFVLQQNGYPEGPAAIPSADALKGVTFGSPE